MFQRWSHCWYDNAHTAWCCPVFHVHFSLLYSSLSLFKPLWESFLRAVLSEAFSRGTVPYKTVLKADMLFDTLRLYAMWTVSSIVREHVLVKLYSAVRSGSVLFPVFCRGGCHHESLKKIIFSFFFKKQFYYFHMYLLKTYCLVLLGFYFMKPASTLHRDFWFACSLSFCTPFICPVWHSAVWTCHCVLILSTGDGLLHRSQVFATINGPTITILLLFLNPHLRMFINFRDRGRWGGGRERNICVREKHQSTASWMHPD